MGRARGSTLALMTFAACAVLGAPAATMMRGDGASLGPDDPEAESALLVYPGESYYNLPRVASLGGETPWIEQLSWSPRAQIYHNFMTPEECAHLIDLARPHMHEANVVDKQTGKSVTSGVRTSTGHFLSRGQDPIVQRIEERIAAFAMVPVDHGEAIQVLRYSDGQKYDPHFDYFHDPNNISRSGQRVATALLYLSDVEEGGETVFPKGTHVDGKGASTALDAAEKELFGVDVSECARGKLHVKPRRGDALLFWSTSLEGWEDDKSLHGGCPVTRGEKWTATKWMRAGPLGGKKEMEVKARIAGAKKEELKDEPRAKVKTGEHDEN